MVFNSMILQQPIQVSEVRPSFVWPMEIGSHNDLGLSETPNFQPLPQGWP